MFRLALKRASGSRSSLPKRMSTVTRGVGLPAQLEVMICSHFASGSSVPRSSLRHVETGRLVHQAETRTRTILLGSGVQRTRFNHPLSLLPSDSDACRPKSCGQGTCDWQARATSRALSPGPASSRSWRALMRTAELPGTSGLPYRAIATCSPSSLARSGTRALSRTGHGRGRGVEPVWGICHSERGWSDAISRCHLDTPG